MQLFNPNGNMVAQALYAIFGEVYIDISPGAAAFFTSAGITILWRVFSRISQHIEKMVVAVYVFFVERKRIISIPWYKKLWFCIMWPAFDIIHRYTTYIALFTKVTWKPIPHTSKITIEDIEQ